MTNSKSVGVSRRALGVATAATTLALALPGCSKDGGEGSADKVEITFLTHWGPEQVTALEKAGKAFTGKNPNTTIKVQAVPFANLLSTLRTQGASPNGPTIAGIYDLWIPELVRDGMAASAPDSFSKDISDNWPENIVGGVSVEGAVYGYPNEVDLYQLNYNKAIFKSAGIAEPPKTFDELRSIAKQLTDKAKGVQGFGVITNWGSGSVHPFLSLAASNGGSMLSQDRKSATLDSPEVLDVAKLYAELVADGATDATKAAANANTTGPYLEAFAGGRTGMIIMANWWQSSLKQAMGAKYADIATAPIPVGPKGSKSSGISYSWLTIVNKRASDAKQKAAWDFLRYLNGKESGANGSSAMADILMGMGILPSRTSDLDAHREKLNDPFLKTYVDNLANATPFPSVVGGDAAVQALQKHIEALLFKRETPEAAMKAANSEVTKALAG